MRREEVYFYDPGPDWSGANKGRLDAYFYVFFTGWKSLVIEDMALM